MINSDCVSTKVYSKKMITLDDSLLINRGSERNCYRHPSDTLSCIKVIGQYTRRTNTRIQRELKYLKKYKQPPNKLELIPDFHGKIDTNLGTGYSFQLITDFDGTISISLANHLKKHGTNYIICQRIVEMYYAFLKSSAVVSDLHPGNLLLQRHSKEDFSLIMIDGFGNSDFVKICDYSSYFQKKKLVRKFQRLLTNMNLPTTDIQ